MTPLPPFGHLLKGKYLQQFFGSEMTPPHTPSRLVFQKFIHFGDDCHPYYVNKMFSKACVCVELSVCVCCLLVFGLGLEGKQMRGKWGWGRGGRLSDPWYALTPTRSDHKNNKTREWLGRDSAWRRGLRQVSCLGLAHWSAGMEVLLL